MRKMFPSCERVPNTRTHTQGRSFQTPQHRTLAPGHLMLYYYIYKHTHTLCACIHCHGTAHNSTSLATQTRRVLITSHTRHARVCVNPSGRSAFQTRKRNGSRGFLFINPCVCVCVCAGDLCKYTCLSLYIIYISTGPGCPAHTHTHTEMESPGETGSVNQISIKPFLLYFPHTFWDGRGW